MRGLLLCLLLVGTVDWTVASRILAVLPMAARSHHNMFQAVLRVLAERGHQVVNYSPYPLDKPLANYTDIHLDTAVPMDKAFKKGALMNLMNMSPIVALAGLWDITPLIMDNSLKNNRFKELLESKDEKFDLVLLSTMFVQEALLGLGHKFNAPIITLHPFGSFSLINKAAGNALSLAYIPDYSVPYSNHMSFYERLLNSYSILRSLHLYYTQHLPAQDKYMRSLFNDPTMPSIVDMLHNISLFVNNAHPNVHYAQPYTPNLISVGGIHLSRGRKPLPPAMQKFIDEAKHGVIYFSLGSFLPDQQLPQKYFENFINVFRKLPQRVLWKTTAEPAGLPDNVMTGKWMPQQDILAHPNVVLFMTHGGLFSQHEAINAGVPVVCIPFFGDQPMNAKFYEEKQIGVRLLFNTLSEETIYSALSSVLHNPKYKDNMKRLSHIYQDRPLSPADSLVFWVEYVLRHGGAHHLRPASTSLHWYQLALLDVLAAILVVLVFGSTAVYLIIHKISAFVWRKKHSDEITSDKKKR